MNDRNRGGMTINALLTLGLILSLLIPIVCLIILGFIVPGSIPPILSVAILCVVVFIGAVATNFFIRRRIQDRLLSLVDVCRNFSGGDRSIRAVVNGDDEFGMLANSLNNLLDNQNASSSSGTALSSGLSDAAALQAQIEKLLQEVSAVGDGDLRVQAEVTPDTLGVLADSFNYMIEELAKVVGRVQNTAVQVTNASRRVLDRSAELAQASETQVVRISQTTEAVEALANFVQDVAHNARSSAESAQDALQNAKTGQGAVRQTIEGMMVIRENVQETAKKIKRLGERSNEIGEIVRIIEDIADQTNLLALNAAIQSAMAGEHGRGFAVVADEIRLLAERSTESTKRIATLVKSIQGDTYEAVVAMEDSTQEVVKGSQLADEAGRALNSIFSAVERQASTIQMIAQAANEQASVSEDVANAMTEISEITNRTNAGTQEAAMSVSYLSELSDQLRASVSTFRLPERASEGPDTFGSLGGVPALPGGHEGGDQFFQQDLGGNGDWNQNFSADFLSLPQPQDNDLSGSGSGFQFTLNGQQDFSNPQSGFGNAQPGFGSSQPGFGNPQSGFGGMPPLPTGQDGFDNQPFGNLSQGFPTQSGFSELSPFDTQQSFDSQPFGKQSFDSPQFGSQPFGNQSSGNQPFGNQQFGNQQFGNQQFGNQQFGGIPESGYGQPHQPSSQMPAISPQNVPPAAGGQVPGRPRWRNGQQGSGSLGSEQMPFPGTGNGHVGQ
ncbi:MAG TPA: methyl-accepting chemotaxis protein [Ktedonobacteraceae bacterium]|jgi:methyl-accepting chemotaxis protein